MNKYYEETRIKAIKNFDYVVKVLNSCKTLEQIEIIQKWGKNVIRRSFKLEPYFGFRYESKMFILKNIYIDGFTQKIEEKIKSLGNEI